MKLNVKLLLIISFFYQIGFGQQSEKPKLIVGIVIDQMRAEYLYRFQENYSENGFKKLIREGFNVKNIHYNYIPTSTGPGHASIFTGTTPANHGIIANNWYNRASGEPVYCVEDKTVYLINNTGIQENSNNNYRRSPKNLQSPNIADEIKLFTNEKSKVIGLSLKDRGAILPVGHLADYAFWYEQDTGHFISSTYYANRLPEWLISFNKKNLADSLLNQTWNTLLPIKKYKNSNIDDSALEKIYHGRKKATFPYNLKKIRKKNGNFKLLAEVPFGNTLLTNLAITTIKEEKLGQDDITDFLTISFSSTDYIGHNFGIRSKEIEDAYIRLDRDLARLFQFLNNKIGKDNYLLFLTADHAASDHPSFLQKKRIPGKKFSTKEIKLKLTEHLEKIFKKEEEYVLYIDKTQIYLNRNVSVPFEKILKESVFFLKTKIKGIKEVIAPTLPKNYNENSVFESFVMKGYNFEFSGDIFMHFKSGWMTKRPYGTTHGNAYNSDTHVPLLWYGWHIPKGETVKPYTITQIVPTLSLLLNIPLPNAASKGPIQELYGK